LQVGQGLDQAEIVALERQFRELMCNPTIRAWYDGTWAVKYHTSLIAPTGQMYRPDRIMMQGTTAMVVDFTVSPEQESSQEELLAAASLLQNMGYGWVRAYRLDIPTQVVHELCVGTGTV